MSFGVGGDWEGVWVDGVGELVFGEDEEAWRVGEERKVRLN